jgi:hypothetical protein
MTQCVYSTHTNSIRYVEWVKDTNQNLNVIKKRLVIQGGHGLTNKYMVTAEGVLTTVSDEDLEWLLTLDSFKEDIKNGYIRHSKRKEDPEKVVRRDMNTKDGSSPLTPKDYIVVDEKMHRYRSKSSHLELNRHE